MHALSVVRMNEYVLKLKIQACNKRHGKGIGKRQINCCDSGIEMQGGEGGAREGRAFVKQKRLVREKRKNEK